MSGQDAQQQSGHRLFVGNLSWDTDDNSLRKAFAQEYKVLDAKVIIDRYTGRSRGFGFVTVDTAEAAAHAKDAMHNKEVDGRAIRVDVATSQRR